MKDVTKPGWLWGPYAPAGLLTAALVAIVDQAHKVWMLDVYKIEEKVRVSLTSFFDLVLSKNTGISYSLFSQSDYQGQIFLAAFAFLASLALWVWLNKDAPGRLMAISLGLIIGGAVGNAIDRLRLGWVADFFDFHAFGYNWYVFNIADIAIVAGVAGLLYDSFITSRKDAANSL